MKQHIIGNVVLRLHGLEAFTQPGIVLCRRRIEIPAHKMEALGKLPPGLIAKAFFLLGMGPDGSAKGVVIPGSAGHPEQSKRLRQQPLTSQSIERRHESRTGQITRHAQNHHHTWLWGHPMHQTRGTRLEALLVHRRLPSTCTIGSWSSRRISAGSHGPGAYTVPALAHLPHKLPHRVIPLACL